MKRYCKNCRKATEQMSLTKNLSGRGLGARQLQYFECQVCGKRNNERIITNYTDKNWDYKLRQVVPKFPKSYQKDM